MFDIADYIPHGRENAVSRTLLSIRTGLSDRQNRELIERSEAVIINLQDGRGYFIPLPSERELVAHYFNQEMKRIRSTYKKLRKIKKWLNEVDGQIDFKKVV